MAWVGRIYDDAKVDPTGFEPHAERLADAFATTPLLLAAVLEALARIARADGPMHPEESLFLERVAGIFRLTGSSARYNRGTFEQPTDMSHDPYAVLGVDRNMPLDEIKAAWRKLTREYHPDNLIAKGLPQENVDLATRKMAEINAAWDRICAERGHA
jgi:DnaJ like chaperone protein